MILNLLPWDLNSVCPQGDVASADPPASHTAPSPTPGSVLEMSESFSVVFQAATPNQGKDLWPVKQISFTGQSKHAPFLLLFLLQIQLLIPSPFHCSQNNTIKLQLILNHSLQIEGTVRVAIMLDCAEQFEQLECGCNPARGTMLCWKSKK